MTMTETIYERAVRVWGKSAQEMQAIGECAEFIDVIAKTRQDRDVPKEDIVDEIADVIIMMQQMRHIHGTDAVEARIKYKLDRVRKKLDKKEGIPPKPEGPENEKIKETIFHHPV